MGEFFKDFQEAILYVVGGIAWLFWRIINADKEHTAVHFAQVDKDIVELKKSVTDINKECATKTDVKDAVETIIESNKNLEIRFVKELEKKADESKCSLIHKLEKKSD